MRHPGKRCIGLTKPAAVETSFIRASFDVHTRAGHVQLKVTYHQNRKLRGPILGRARTICRTMHGLCVQRDDHAASRRSYSQLLRLSVLCVISVSVCSEDSLSLSEDNEEHPHCIFQAFIAACQYT